MFALLVVVCKLCRVAQQHSMQSIDYCTGGHTKLYAVRACCTVCNTHGEHSCEAMAEWEMFEADLRNVGSLSSTNFFRFVHCVNIGVQRDCFPGPVPSGKAIFALQKHIKVFFFKRPALCTFAMAGEEKSTGKALLLYGFLSY